LLRPLYYRLREKVLSTDYIQVDETTIPVVDNEKSRAVKGYLWMVRLVMENMVFFRPVALGRKNYLFYGNHSAAEDAAVIYSLLGCCKAQEVNFRDWLIYVLDNIHSYDEDYSKDLAELLP